MNRGAKWTPLAPGVLVGETAEANLLAVVGTRGALVHGPASPDDLDGLVVGGRDIGPADVTWATHPGLDAPLLLHEDDPLADRAGQVVVSVWPVDLGDAYAEVVHPGRGATGSDLVVVVPGPDVLATGNLVRVPGPPGYGEASWPLEWPATLDMVLGTLSARTRVVPGRGPVVDREAVEDQRQEVLAVAEQVDVLAGRGVRADEAYPQGTWPYAEAALRPALVRAFEQWTPRPQARHAH